MRAQNKKFRVKRILIWIVLVIAVLVVTAVTVFLVMRSSGKRRLERQTLGITPILPQSEMLDVDTLAEGWQEGDVRYQGVHYRYNSDIMTFLFLGIDKMDKVKPAESGIDGGQADAIFLLVLNPHSKKISVIGVNRDTMTDVDVYNQLGEFMNTSSLQLCLQHGYGDGARLSCERTVAAVSKLFYGLPITGYCSIHMGAIPKINDAIGGVTLVALEDVVNTNIKKGQEVHLQGMDAYYYLHNRDTKVEESARMRLERQKQYLNAYSDTVMASLKANLTLPMALYWILEDYMVTDVTLDEVSYLATLAADYQFDSDRIYTLEGKTEEVGSHEGFYPDETALYELILDIFYEEVGE